MSSEDFLNERNFIIKLVSEIEIGDYLAINNRPNKVINYQKNSYDTECYLTIFCEDLFTKKVTIIHKDTDESVFTCFVQTNKYLLKDICENKLVLISSQNEIKEDIKFENKEIELEVKRLFLNNKLKKIIFYVATAFILTLTGYKKIEGVSKIKIKL